MDTRSPGRASLLSALLFSATLLSASALAGCDPGKEPFLNGALAEEKGDYAAAAPNYEEVCTKKSQLCDAARKRQARMALKRAMKAIDDGHYKEAKGLLDALNPSPDPTTTEEATALLALPELLQGILYEDALANPDKTLAMGAMEGIAREPSALAPKAKEWLDKNRPALLLAQAKDACAGGKGDCVDLAKKLQTEHPESPEAKEAATLAADSYKRLYPKLKDLENLLIQRVGVYDKDTKMELCKKSGASEDDCNQRVTGEGPTLSYLEDFWKKKLTDLGDTHYTAHFQKRWDKASAGEYDPEPWPKP
jgi:hypothetical protein